MILNSKQFLLAVFSLLSLPFLPACWPFGKKSEQKPKFYLVNVLDKSAFDDCNIEGSINVPFEDVEKFAQGLDKDAEVVFYCANYMCTASGASAEKLKQMGFEKVWAYEGGTAEWRQLGLAEEGKGKFPVRGVCQAGYLNAPNEKHEAPSSVPTLSAEELREKLKINGILAQ